MYEFPSEKFKHYTFVSWQYLFAEMATDRIADHAKKYSEDPLFLYMAFTAAHTPLEAPPELIQMVKNYILLMMQIVFYKYLSVPKGRQ